MKSANLPVPKPYFMRVRYEFSGILDSSEKTYKFVGVLSQDEFRAETQGKSLSYTPEGFIIVLDDPPVLPGYLVVADSSLPHMGSCRPVKNADAFHCTG